jgi:hypothetical protein
MPETAMPETDLPIDDNDETTKRTKKDDSQSLSPLPAMPTEEDQGDTKPASSNPYEHGKNWLAHGPDK